MRNCFPKHPPGAPLHTLSKLYDVPGGFVPPSFGVMYCFICGRRRVAVALYRMICLVLDIEIKIYFLYQKFYFLIRRILFLDIKKYTYFLISIIRFPDIEKWNS